MSNIANEAYTLQEMVDVAKSLEPVEGSEYARGICELIGRLLLDVGGFGEGTGENAALIADKIFIRGA